MTWLEKEKKAMKDWWKSLMDIQPMEDKPLDKDLILPMDYKYSSVSLPLVGKSIPPTKDTAKNVMQPSPWNCAGGINIHIPTAKDTMKYGKGMAVSASFATTSSYVPSMYSTGGLGGPILSASWATYSTTASYATGFNPNWVGAISGRYTMTPCMEATLNVTVNMGDPANSKATVSFRGEELTRMVWLNNNVDVVKSALLAFNKAVVESSGAGKPWFNCACKGISTIYQDMRVTFHGLVYSDHVIKSCLMHRVDVEGADPMKVLTEIATTHNFFIVGDMEVDDDEGVIESLVVKQLWKYCPQKQKNVLIFDV